MTDFNGLWVNKGNGSFKAEKGDTLIGLQRKTGRNWHTSNFKGNPRKLQIGQNVSFAAKNKRTANITIDSTGQAWHHYYHGHGESANIGPNTIQALMQSPEQRLHEGRIRKGLTSSLQGNYSVNLTFSARTFYIGHTPVDYSTTCGSAFCVTDFSAFRRDGFWDVDDLLNVFHGDTMGPKEELPGGHPYHFVPFNWTISYPNRYKAK